MDTIGYIYEGGIHCESCALERFPELTGTDREGNEVGIYTESEADAYASCDTCCETCGELLHEFIPDVIKAKPGDKSRLGIHLLNPSDEEIEQAKDHAKKDCFRSIYIHTNHTWNTQSPDQRRAGFKLIQGGAA